MYNTKKKLQYGNFFFVFGNIYDYINLLSKLDSWIKVLNKVVIEMTKSTDVVLIETD